MKSIQGEASMRSQQAKGIQISGDSIPRQQEILTTEALNFVAKLHRQFDQSRKSLLQNRQDRQARILKGKTLEFLPDTANIREDLSWKVAPIPADLENRRVEITGPVERKMMINALNSGANVFMADFEDALSPTWQNIIEGQANLIDAVEGTIAFDSPDGKHYALKEKPAVLMVRPRGWHLNEKHLLVDGEEVSASLFDFALYFFHNARKLIRKGTGPYFYLPKMQSHLEARLWNQVFLAAQAELKIPPGTIRATVLIETIFGAFEMEEILYELKDHIAGLNAGRWDYIFSIIKTFRAKPDFVFPDRSQITMTVPFMRAYTDLLVHTCHKRGAHAMGGMVAFIPSRKDKEVNETALKKVREDKLRETKDGFDGTWVAHPDLVPIAAEIFDKALGNKANQKDVLREKVKASPKKLLDFQIPDGEITEAGLRHNIAIALIYLESWLKGIGAVAIFNLMEDAATAEISRAQVWQWTHHPKTSLSSGDLITLTLVKKILDEELLKIREKLDPKVYEESKFELVKKILENLITDDKFADFLTSTAYEFLT